MKGVRVYVAYRRVSDSSKKGEKNSPRILQRHRATGGVNEKTFAEETETDYFASRRVVRRCIRQVKAVFDTLVEAGYPLKLLNLSASTNLKLIEY
jgi:ketol-acid reductoisomerase